ncbi:MAG: thioredoxin family protein [Candidatus Omnitrophica bacterium]|nr:thioredoxin family protein [Candidatus Omnitrophota bacterium]
MRRFLKNLTLTLSLCFLGVNSLWAQPVRTEHVRAELLSEVEWVQPGQTFWVAVRVKTLPHWHTYWKNPGDSGLPTRLSWKLPEGFEAGPVHWPYPERIELGPLANFGFEREIFLLTEISVSPKVEPGQSVEIGVRADWLVCKESCVPEGADLSLKMPVRKSIPPPSLRSVGAFAQARSELPVDSRDWQVEGVANSNRVVLNLAPRSPLDRKLKKLQFFPVESGLVEYAADQELEEEQGNYVLSLQVSSLAQGVPQRAEGVLVADFSTDDFKDVHALNIDIPLGPLPEDPPAVVKVPAPLPESPPEPVADSLLPLPAGPAQAPVPAMSLWLALIFAFLGGVILNLMPCVLPVLSLKILSLVEKTHHKGEKPWQHGLVFGAGVLVSFWILAGLLLALRAGGAQLGWGFQLQSPPFLVALSCLFFLLGLSLFGVFEIGLSISTQSAKASRKTGFTGSFLSGFLATAVATPCTAPFMGSALGYGLTQSPWVSMLIFTGLGLGMASPYVLLSSSPALLRYVPKPGRWMESFKQFLGFLLMVTVWWLLWVLGHQAGTHMVLKLLFAFWVAGIGAWVLGRWGSPSQKPWVRAVARVTALLLILLAVIWAMSKAGELSPMPGTPAAAPQELTLQWEPYSESRVQALRAQGEPVFVDFTAAWCLTCQVNKRVALHTPEVEKRFETLGVHLLVADWTSRDAKITQALQRFGRSGVPLYVLYGRDPQAPPQILPEVLTPGIVLAALDSLE